MYQQLWGDKVEEKLYLGVREQKRLNTTGLLHAKWKSRLTSEMASVSNKYFTSRIIQTNTNVQP
jgi:hypothetical protein